MTEVCFYRYGLPTWDFFPRSLSKKEFLNPYLAFEKFFKYHTLPEWRDELQDIIMYALNGDSTDESGIYIDYLGTHRHLQKLIEAAYLIDVRKIEPESE